MTYRIQQSAAADFLQLEIDGALVHADLERLRRDVAQRARAAGTRRLLIDVRGLAYRNDPVETLRLVESYADEKPSWRTAVLETPAQAEAHHFHETAALNRGFEVLHFTDRAKAEAWLTR